MILSDKHSTNIYIWGDLCAFFLTFIVSFSLYYDNNFTTAEWMFLSGMLGLWLIIGYLRTQYWFGLKQSFFSQYFNFTQSYFVLVVLVSLFFYFFNFPIYFRNVLIAFFIGLLIMGITTNFFIDLITNILSKQQKEIKYTLLASSNHNKGFLEKNLSFNSYKQIKGFIKTDKNQPLFIENERGENEMSGFLNQHHIDEIIIALPLKRTKKIQKIMDMADYHGIRVKCILDYQSNFGRNCKIIKYGSNEALSVRQLPLDEKFSALLKSTFDFVFSSFAILILSPIFLIIGLLIKLDSPGKIFYCPIRTGRGGTALKIYKFRTMINCDNPLGGIRSTEKNDQRITNLGKTLRKYNLDELPQFINVFLGEMSVVGPRPHRTTLNKEFQETEENYMIRHYFKPGITGWAQVNGWRGPTATKEQKHQRTHHDLWYLENWTFKLDLKIIYLTICGKKTNKNAF